MTKDPKLDITLPQQKNSLSDFYLLLIRLVSPIFTSRLVQFLLPNNFFCIAARVTNLARHGQVDAVLETLDLALNKAALRENGAKWWYLLKLGIISLQEQHLNDKMPGDKIENKFIAHALVGPEPQKGYNVAYVYIIFAIWMLQKEDLSQAQHYIWQAMEADANWGYPEYLYGWLGLFKTEIDAAYYFSKAIAYNWNFLSLLQEDPIVQQRPDITKKVYDRMLVTKNNMLP